MERPFAVIGFTYLSALLVALFIGALSSLFSAILLLSGFIISLFIKPLRKNSIVPVVLITSAVSMFSFYLYSSVYVLPTKELEGKTANVTATLCDMPYEQNGRYYYKLETHSIDAPYSVQNTKILVSSKNAYDIDLYDNIAVNIKFFENSDNTYTNYYISKGIMLRGSIDDYSEIKISENSDKPLYYYALKIKSGVIDIIHKSLPKKEASFVIALLLGDKTEISKADKKIFTSAGISHIISVSGFHISVVTQIFMFFLCFLTKRERLSAIICAFIIFLFIAIVGFSPSVVRAGIMQIVYLIGKSIIRQSDSINSLGFSALLICFLNPYSAADVGFLLSFCATFGIILCSNKIIIFISEHICQLKYRKNSSLNTLEKIFSYFLKAIISIISITISANVFTLPITIMFFKEIALYSILSNLMISFAASVLIFAVIVMVLLQVTNILSFLALPFIIISGVFTNYIIWTAQTVSSIPFSKITVSAGFVPLWLGFMLLLASFIYILKNRKRTMRYFVLIAVISFLSGYVSYSIFRYNSFKISILDVGQGLSIVLTENGETVVLSCGGEAPYASVLNDYLESTSAKNIFFLLLLSNKNENSAFTEKLLEEFPASNIQVYGEDNYYEYMHQLIFRSPNIILSDENSKNKVYWNDITIESYGNTAIYFKKNSIDFLICNNNTDCSVLPAEWLNPDFLIIDGILKNPAKISPNYIIISNSRKNLSYSIPQLSILSSHIYSTGNDGNLALWIYNDNTMSIRRENEWLS